MKIALMMRDARSASRCCTHHTTSSNLAGIVGLWLIDQKKSWNQKTLQKNSVDRESWNFLGNPWGILGYRRNPVPVISPRCIHVAPNRTLWAPFRLAHVVNAASRSLILQLPVKFKMNQIERLRRCFSQFFQKITRISIDYCIILYSRKIQK